MKFIFLGVIFLLLQSCSPGVRVSIDSISSQKAKEKNKYLIVAGEGFNESDLQFQEFANYTDKVLRCSGFEKSSNLENADVAIFLSYGISEPHLYQYTYSTPVYGQIGVSSAITHGTVNACGNSAAYSSTTSYTPTYGITGYQTNIGTDVLFTRHFALEGVDRKDFLEKNKLTPLWSTKAVSIGASGDLRKMFPILLVASKNYIGTNTGKKIEVEIKENDKRILELTDGL